MAGAADNPTQGTHPALSPPPIMPSNTFVPRDDDYTLAVRLLAEILMDDEWHHIEDVVDEIEWETELPGKAVRKIVMRCQSHGDIRRDDEWIRLTTRWKSYHANEAVGA